MIDAALSATLAEMAARLRATPPRDPWWVIGSAALALAGVEGIAPNDVDLLLSVRDADACVAAHADCLESGDASAGQDRFRSRFARLRFAPMPVEVMGGLQVHRDGRWKPVGVGETRIVALGAAAIRIPGIDEQLRLLELFGRDKDLAKAQRLRHFMSGEPAHVH